MLCAVYLGRKIQPAYHTGKRFKKHIEEHLTGSKALRVVMLQPVSKVDVSLVPSGGCRFVLKYLRLWASGLSLLICFQTGVVFPIYGGKAHVIAPDTRPRVTVASLANEQQCHLPPSAEQRTHYIHSKNIQGSWELANTIEMWFVVQQMANEHVPQSVVWKMLKLLWLSEAGPFSALTLTRLHQLHVTF